MDFCSQVPQHSQHILGCSQRDKQMNHRLDLFLTANQESAQHVPLGVLKDQPPIAL